MNYVAASTFTQKSATGSVYWDQIVDRQLKETCPLPDHLFSKNLENNTHKNTFRIFNSHLTFD